MGARIVLKADIGDLPKDACIYFATIEPGAFSRTGDRSTFLHPMYDECQHRSTLQTGYYLGRMPEYNGKLYRRTLEMTPPGLPRRGSCESLGFHQMDGGSRVEWDQNIGRDVGG
jgi:hypothetical protein